MSACPSLPVLALTRRVLTSTTIGCLIAAPATAQTIPDGARVRITTNHGAGDKHEGVIVKSSADTVWFAKKKSNAIVALPILEGYRVEQSTHYKPRFVRGLVGAGVAMAVWGAGSFLVIGGCIADATWGVCYQDENGIYAVAAVGGVLFTALGGAIGSSTGREQWKVVSMPRRVSTLHLPARQVRLGSIKF